MKIEELKNTIIKGGKYNCVYVSGGGEEFSDGHWEVKTLTDKTMIIEKISDRSLYGNYEKGDRIICRKGNGNPLKIWDDGTFTIYPNQSGTPYYFELINRKNTNEYKNNHNLICPYCHSELKTLPNGLSIKNILKLADKLSKIKLDLKSKYALNPKFEEKKRGKQIFDKTP